MYTYYNYNNNIKVVKNEFYRLISIFRILYFRAPVRRRSERDVARGLVKSISHDWPLLKRRCEIKINIII